MKSSYQKLKEKLAKSEAEKIKLRNDLRKIVVNDCKETFILYKMEFEYEDSIHRSIWMGDASSGIKFSGLHNLNI